MQLRRPSHSRLNPVFVCALVAAAVLGGLFRAAWPAVAAGGGGRACGGGGDLTLVVGAQSSLTTSGGASNQSADASAPESHRQLVVRQLYEQPKRFSDVSYLELLEDEGLAPLTKAAQRWIYEAQHPDPATCTQQQFVVAGEECLPDGNGLGSCIHIAGEHLSAALQHGAAVVWAKDAGVQFVDRGCGAGEPHANMLCLFEPPSSCGLEHVTPGNNLGFRYFKEGGPAFKDRGLKFEPHAPPRLVAKLRERLVPMGIDAMPDFLKYWWRVQSAAYLARPNARLRGELARLRRRRDMFLRLTPQRKVSPPSYPLPPGTVHVRVRHAAAKGAEMLLLPLGKYLEAAEHRVVNTNPLAFKKYGILSTDDTDIVKEAAKVEKLTGHPETSPDGSWVLFASNDNRTDKGGVDWSEELKALGAQRQISSHLLNLFVALECDAWVGTRGSNWDRLIDELRCVWVDKCTQPYVEAGPAGNWKGYGWRRR